MGKTSPPSQGLGLHLHFWPLPAGVRVRIIPTLKRSVGMMAVFPLSGISRRTQKFGTFPGNYVAPV